MSVHAAMIVRVRVVAVALCVLVAGSTLVFARGGRCPPCDSRLKRFDGVILRLDLKEGSVTVTQPFDRNVMAVVVCFSASTRISVDSKPTSMTSLKAGMPVTVEMSGRRMTELAAQSFH